MLYEDQKLRELKNLSLEDLEKELAKETETANRSTIMMIIANKKANNASTKVPDKVKV